MHSEKKQAPGELIDVQPPTTGRHLWSQLLTHKTYFFTCVVGLLAPLLIVFLFSSAANLFQAILFFVVIVISTIYLFYALSRMLIVRFAFDQIRFPANLLFVTLTMYIGLTIFWWVTTPLFWPHLG